MSSNQQNVGKDLVAGDFRLTEGLRTSKWPLISVFDSVAQGSPRATGGILQTLYRACPLSVCVLWVVFGFLFVFLSHRLEKNIETRKDVRLQSLIFAWKRSFRTGPEFMFKLYAMVALR